MEEPKTFSTITVGGGCFWCIEALFEGLEGVQDVVSGYAAGKADAPTYEQVCSGSTGHAEVIQVRFDPAAITIAELYDHFFKVHDPTTQDRQGGDIGTQYRSIILYHEAEQKPEAESALERATQLWDAPIVTQIEPLETFFKAEDYHQDYFRRNPDQAYCAAVIAPKLKKFQS